ncbi:MAG TPA: hypothetical protein VN922_03165, partial [Bacteroidia bacterium]|nr:hypothetical protein [Bacteroidia bacterium]
MKTIRIILAFIGFALLGINAHAQNGIKDDTVVIVGQIVKEQFVHNKPVKGVYDYFFESGTKKYFIKTYKGKFSKKELDAWVHYAARVKAIV